MGSFDSGTLFLLMELSSVVLFILFSGIYLIRRYRRYRITSLLFAALFFLMQSIGVISLLSNAFFGISIFEPYGGRVDLVPLLLGFPPFLTLAAYLIECKRPQFFTWERIAVYLAPIIIVSACCVLSGCPTDIRTMKDIRVNMLKPDVLLRLALWGLYVIYGITATVTPPRHRGNMIPTKFTVALGFLTSMLPFTFFIGMCLGILPIAIIHSMLLITIDAVILYIEIKVRILIMSGPKPEPEPEPKPAETKQDCHIFDDEVIWKDPDMNAADLAEMMHVSRGRLSTMLKEAGYLSYNDMVNHKRVNYICTKLSEDARPDIIQVMYDSGFRSRSSASAAFKSITGCTPSEYIRKQ